jgi:peptidoglycan-associated lipoprotein
MVAFAKSTLATGAQVEVHRVTTFMRWSIGSALVMVSACGAQQKPAPVAPTLPTPTPAHSSPLAATSEHRTQVAISNDIRKACGISDVDAFFAYDSARVRSEDTAPLAKLAECFASGALRGREMRLVGHADPRGDGEYNYLLGQRRADNVKTGIVSVGLSAERIATSSRGENEAKGTSEASWTRDRRVDVLLGN